MSAHRYVVQRIGIASLASWGFVAGALVACLPALACSGVFFALTAALHRAIEGWRDVGVTVLGQRLALNLIELLHLQAFLNALQLVDRLGVLGILLLGLVLAAALGAIVAVSFAIVGLVYNATGRMELTLVEK